MLEALSGKVFATMVSLSMFLFSSYTGNDPGFRALNSRTGGNYLQLRTSLVSAFDNDFPDVFKSGVRIPVIFTLYIKSGKRTLAEYKYQNTVQYDPSKGSYAVYTAGMNKNIQTTSYQQMIQELSLFECSIPYRADWGKVSVRVEASLPTVRFTQIKNPVDLMVLWRYQRPQTSINLDLRGST